MRGFRTGPLGRGAFVVGAAAVAVTVLAAGCTSTGGAGPSTVPPTVTSTSIVGTSTLTSTVTTVLGTLTVPASERTTVTVSAPRSTAAGPPPSTQEPKPTPGTCPYLSDEDVKNANGQHTGQTSLIKTKPYPVCIFTRSDGGYLATTRIVVAKTAAAAAAAVNQHVPVDRSDPATQPQGWTGGAMGNLNGVDGYPDAKSIYAVSKGKIAIIAISNQAQSIKGRQMVEDIVTALDL